MYNYLDHFFESGAEEMSRKDKSFLEDLSKGFRVKKAYAASKRDINYTKNVFNDLVWNNKTIDDVF